MGIFDALNTAVGGLQAQSFALQNISGNIANASTIGYKGIDTSFEDLIPDATTPNKQVAGGVTAFAQATITTQGTVSSTTVATNMAINGDGFFSVQQPTGIVRQRAGLQRRHRLHPSRRFPGQRQRQSGQRRRLLSDGRRGRSEDRKPARQRSAGSAVSEQFHSGAGDHRHSIRREPSDRTGHDGKSHRAHRTLTAAGGLNPADFSQNPEVAGTPATPYGDATVTGAAALNQAATPGPITAATTLSGAAPSDSLTHPFVAGDSITVDGVVLNFSAAATSGSFAGAGPFNINVGDTVGTLLGAIGTITGVAPTIDATTGAITLHTGAAQDLSVSSSSAGFGALGFATTDDGSPDRRRYGRYRLRGRQ